MQPRIDFRFVQARPDEAANGQNAGERTELRSHASRMGYRNARNRQPTSVSSGQSSIVGEGMQVKLSAMKSKFRLAIKQKSTTGSRFILESGRNDKLSARFKSLSQTPSPPQLISAEVNCPQYLHIWTQKLFANTSTFHQCFNVYDVQSFDSIRPYLEQEVFRNSIAAVSYAIYQLRSSSEATSKALLSYRGQALSNLRQRLDGSCIDGAVVLSILYLVILEALLGNFKVSEMHKAVLRHLVQQKGLETIDEHIRCSVLQQNQYWLDAGVPPILPPSSPTTILAFPSIPLSSSIQSQVDQLPIGFRKLASQGSIATSLLSVLFRIHNVHLDRQKSTRASPLPYLDASMIDGGRRHQTLLDACPVLEMPETNDNIFQKILCWTLLVYSMLYLSNANAVSPLPLRARSELTTKLYRLPEQPSELHEKCVFWMWHVVVQSWRLPAGELEEQGRVLKQGQEARFQDLYQNGQAKQVLQDFSWCAEETLPERCNSDLLKQLDEAQAIIDEHCPSFM